MAPSRLNLVALFALMMSCADVAAAFGYNGEILDETGRDDESTRRLIAFAREDNTQEWLKGAEAVEMDRNLEASGCSPYKIVSGGTSVTFEGQTMPLRKTLDYFIKKYISTPFENSPYQWDVKQAKRYTYDNSMAPVYFAFRGTDVMPAGAPYAWPTKKFTLAPEYKYIAVPGRLLPGFIDVTCVNPDYLYSQDCIGLEQQECDTLLSKGGLQYNATTGDAIAYIASVKERVSSWKATADRPYTFGPAPFTQTLFSTKPFFVNNKKVPVNQVNIIGGAVKLDGVVEALGNSPADPEGDHDDCEGIPLHCHLYHSTPVVWLELDRTCPGTIKLDFDAYSVTPGSPYPSSYSSYFDDHGFLIHESDLKSHYIIKV